MNNLNKYHAIKTALDLSRDGRDGWKVTEGRITEIKKLFEPYVNEGRLVVIPRFNGSYVSLRYCGLEVLRLSPNGSFSTCIECTQKGIRGIKKQKAVSQLDELKPLLSEIKNFLEGYLHDFKLAAKTPKQAKKVPGFSLEHWLESIILADNPIGEKARIHLGLNRDLTMVVSQVPVIMLPKGDSKAKTPRKRHHHIDLLSVGNDGRVSVVELKIDKDLPKAKKELLEYTNWLLRKDDQFDQERWNPTAMMKECYLPKANYEKHKDAPQGIDAVAVVLPGYSAAGPELSVKPRVVELPEDWLYREGGIFAS